MLSGNLAIIFKNKRGRLFDLDESFEKILLEAMEEALSSLGGEVKTSIFFHLEDLFNIKKQEILHRINDFSSAIKQIFGLGAKHLEILFIKSLHAKIDSERKWFTSESKVPKLTFQECVQLLKQNFEKAGVNEKELRF